MWYVVHPSAPYYSGIPFKNFGTPLGVHCTIHPVESTALNYGEQYDKAVTDFQS